MSEFTDTGQARLLDEVRAKILYLAGDVETASRPAAIMLRAVARSIEEATVSTEQRNGRSHMNGVRATNGIAAPLR